MRCHLSRKKSVNTQKKGFSPMFLQFFFSEKKALMENKCAVKKLVLEIFKILLVLAH